MSQEEKVLEETKEEMTLQETFGQLDQVIADMQKGEVSLEESFRLYHKGMELLKSCNDKIDKVEKKMQILDSEGEEHDFEE